jgi:ubiquinone/menaquinone biosynthesis C-methylase UbiE
MEDKKFNPINKKKLNNPQRFKFVPLERISEILNITTTGNLADYGAGTGFFTFRIADMYPDCRIFALDIEEQMINEMYDAAECENVFPLQIEDNEMPFAKDDLLAVWSIAVYHEMKTPKTWLKNVNKTLKAGAKLLIIDWSVDQKPELEVGPPISHRIKTETVIADLQSTGFKNIKIEQGFTNHFAIIAEK